MSLLSMDFYWIDILDILGQCLFDGREKEERSTCEIRNDVKTRL